MSANKAEIAKVAARQHRERAAALRTSDPQKAKWHQRQADLLTQRAIKEMEDDQK